MGWGRRTAVAGMTLVVLAGGYLTADAYDVVPGFVTLDPPDPTANPFPTAPGATPPPPLTTPLPALGTTAPLPTAVAVQAAVTEAATDRRLGPPAVGIVVADVATGEVLGSAAPNTALVPASSQKLLTAAAALAGPGPTTTMPTSTVLGGDGTLALVGGGDMLLGSGAGNPGAVNGRAGLGDLAKATADKVKAAGLGTVRLVVDDSLFPGPAIPPSWDRANVRAGFGAPVTALAVNIARLGPQEYAPRSADPSLAAGQVFAARLKEQGVEVSGPSRGSAPAGGTKLAEVRSAPMADVVDYFLQHSDNTITEVVGRLVAIDAGQPGTTAGATEAVLAAVRRLGVDLTGARLTDCSGLGEGSRLTATQLVAVVRLLNDPKQPALRSAAVGLPISGLRGTLDDRLADGPAGGVVRAKTGSLPGVTSLAGTVVTADDRLLAFAVLADSFQKGTAYAAHQPVDRLVDTLAGCGCGGAPR